MQSVIIDCTIWSVLACMHFATDCEVILDSSLYTKFYKKKDSILSCSPFSSLLHGLNSVWVNVVIVIFQLYLRILELKEQGRNTHFLVHSYLCYSLSLLRSLWCFIEILMHVAHNLKSSANKRHLQCLKTLTISLINKINSNDARLTWGTPGVGIFPTKFIPGHL